MKTVAYLICAALIALVAMPQAAQVMRGFQADLRENLACTAATYAALDGDAAEADYERATKLCPDDPGLPERVRQRRSLPSAPGVGRLVCIVPGGLPGDLSAQRS